MSGATRILVTGANGQVGHELLRALAKRRIPLDPPSERRGSREARGDEIARSKSHPPRSPFLRKGEACSIVPATRDGQLEDGTPCERMDLADPGALREALDRIQPDLIINAAAYTAVDRAEDEPDLAMRVNGDALGVLGAWAAHHSARIVHYSTDYVFDGAATRPYREDDATHPVSVYGRTKLAGEIALRDSGARHLIFRTAWVYAARGRNFLRTMLRLGAERESLSVVDDQIGAPTPAPLIAVVTARAIAHWYAGGDDSSSRLDGFYHLVAAGSTSWCGFARAIFEDAVGMGLLARAPRVTAIRTADYPTRAKRPAWSVLDTAKLRATFDIALPDWQMCLDEVIRQLARAE